MPAIPRRTPFLMPSLKQIEANRLNARKSTGPRTPEGKAKSRFNALKAGIDAGAEAIPGEDPDELLALSGRVLPRLRAPPARAIRAGRRPHRLRVAPPPSPQNRGPTLETGDRAVPAAIRVSTPPRRSPAPSLRVENRLTRLQRRMDSADRAYHRALNQIRRLQQAPLGPFQAEPPAEQPAEPPAPSAQPPSNQEHSSAIGFVPSIPVVLSPGSEQACKVPMFLRESSATSREPIPLE